MLGSASETLKHINSQASVLEARVVQTQMENEAKLARQKAVFEQKLRIQEDHNKDLVRDNTQISTDIAALKANNSDLKKHAKELQDGSRLMRTELRALQSRFHTALDFVGSSLKSSDDSKAPELEVLQPAKATQGSNHRGHHAYIEYGKHGENKAGGDSDGVQEDEGGEGSAEDDDADEDDDEGEDAATSLIAVAEQAQRVAATGTSEAAEADLPAADVEANPQDLLAVLSRGVTDLQKQEHESEAKLKAMFLESFQTGTRRHASLIAQQRALNSSRASLSAMQTKLRRADARLEATGAGLRQRLRELGLFLQRLAHLPLAPAEEAPRLLKALPEDVSAAATLARRE